MAAPRLLTYFDVIQHIDEFMAGRESVSPGQKRRAVQQAYRDLADAHDWSFLLRNGRIPVKAAVSITASYDHTGGTYERQLTVTSGTLSSNYQDWAVRVGNAVCDIEQIKSASVATLDATMNPGEDVASGTCTLYPRWYVLPSDFSNLVQPATETSWWFGDYRPPHEIMAMDRYDTSTGDMRYYTVAEVPDLYGSMGLFVWPPSDADSTVDFIYKRQPRALRYTGHDANDYIGTISVTAGSASVTGSGTAFADAHVGSVLRISSTSLRPTGVDGDNPYAEERTVIARASALGVTLDAAVSTTRSGVKYVLSDPIDVGANAQNAFLRLVEKHLAVMRNFKDRVVFELAAERAIASARGGDARTRQRRVAGGGIPRMRRLSDGATDSNSWD